MRRSGFTILELIAVLAIMGILAGAAVWSVAGWAASARRADLLERIAALDNRGRAAARRLGRPGVLEIDLDADRLARRPAEGRPHRARPLPVALPAGYEIDRLRVPKSPTPAGYTAARPEPGLHRRGKVTLGYGTGGRSVSYALRLTRAKRASAAESRAASGSKWLVVSGLTGETTVVEKSGVIEKLFRALETGRVHAD